MYKVIRDYVSKNPNSNFIILFQGFVCVIIALLMISVGILVTKVLEKPIPLDCCTWMTLLVLFILMILGAFAVLLMIYSVMATICVIYVLYNVGKVCINGCDEIRVLIDIIFRNDNYEVINDTSSNNDI
jgi:hypothetical protein